ncbi:unnamed protein product [Aphis gossypii]|uniref:Uncharacterized protein n=1 Tax=Aphis gossypii TaxID=80765 RepID=A0A9P0N8F1_APHGO|nr:unnamed protein product [Aphis gossypii]
MSKSHFRKICRYEVLSLRRVVRCRTVRAHAAVHIPKYANPVYQPPPPLNVEIVQLITKASRWFNSSPKPPIWQLHYLMPETI